MRLSVSWKRALSSTKPLSPTGRVTALSAFDNNYHNATDGFDRICPRTSFPTLQLSTERIMRPSDEVGLRTGIFEDSKIFDSENLSVDFVVPNKDNPASKNLRRNQSAPATSRSIVTCCLMTMGVTLPYDSSGLAVYVSELQIANEKFSTGHNNDLKDVS